MDATNASSTNQSGLVADCEQWLCAGSSFFDVWDDDARSFQPCLAYTLPVATRLLVLLLLLCLQLSTSARTRPLVLPYIYHAVLWMLHLVVLVCTGAGLLHDSLSPSHPDSPEAHLRIRDMFALSRPLTWAASYGAVFVRQQPSQVAACFVFWILHAAVSAPLFYNQLRALVSGVVLPVSLQSPAGGTECIIAETVLGVVGAIYVLAWSLSQRPVRGVFSDGKMQCPIAGAGPLNRLFFNWCWPLVKLGSRRPLQSSDIWAPVAIDRVGVNSAMFQHYWRRQHRLLAAARGGRDGSGARKGLGFTRGSLIRGFLAMYWRPFLWCGLMQIAAAAFDFIGPVMLSAFVSLAQQPDADLYTAMGYVLLLTAGRGASAVLQQQQQFLVSRLGLRISGALKGAVFIKVLSLSAEERQARSAGDVVNLVTVDVQRVSATAPGLWSALVLPGQIGVAMVLLWQAIGPSMLAGLAGMLFILALNYVIAGYSKTVSERVMDQKDLRMKATTELLNSMRQIKLAALELRFRDKILDLREEELALIWQQLLLGATNIFLLWMAPLLISVGSFAALTLVARRPMAPEQVPVIVFLATAGSHEGCIAGRLQQHGWHTDIQ